MRHDLERELQLVLHLDRSARDRDWLDVKGRLLNRKSPSRAQSLVCEFELRGHRQRAGHPVQSKLARNSSRILSLTSLRNADSRALEDHFRVL